MASSRKPWPELPAGARRQWAADRALRPAMRSPGRPEPSRAVQREFWRLIATGVTTVEASEAVGVSWPVGARWFRHAGGMPPLSLDEPSGRYLSFAEREEIAILRAQDKGVREIAREMGVASSAVYRYVPSRDDLLTLLLVDGYTDLADRVDAPGGCQPPHRLIRRHR